MYAIRSYYVKGGHSGGELHMGRGNANILGVRFLRKSAEKFDTRLAFIEGGGKHNAIPREFFATLLVKNSDAAGFEAYAAEYAGIIKSEFKIPEPVITSYSIHYTKLYESRSCPGF